MNRTSIEWTHRPGTVGMTWNPIRARGTDPLPESALADGPRTGTFCTRISPGCTNCYASVINKRFGNGLEYTVPNLERVEFFVDEKILAEPVRYRKPATIFVGDMFDLFHEAIPAKLIQQVFAEIAKSCHRHTFQILTKRAERMRKMLELFTEMTIWLGVSVENRAYRWRIDELRRTNPAVRFVSFEPALEDYGDVNLTGIDWAIFGGESGAGARPCNLAWAEALHARCKMKEFQTAFFMKQLGSRPQVHSCRNEACTHPDCGFEDVKLKDRKGGDPDEWPEHLRVREFPTVKTEAVTA